MPVDLNIHSSLPDVAAISIGWFSQSLFWASSLVSYLFFFVAICSSLLRLALVVLILWNWLIRIVLCSERLQYGSESICQPAKLETVEDEERHWLVLTSACCISKCQCIEAAQCAALQKDATKLLHFSRRTLLERSKYTISVCNKPTRSTQPSIPPGSLNRVPALLG